MSNAGTLDTYNADIQKRLGARWPHNAEVAQTRLLTAWASGLERPESIALEGVAAAGFRFLEGGHPELARRVLPLLDSPEFEFDRRFLAHRCGLTDTLPPRIPFLLATHAGEIPNPDSMARQTAAMDRLAAVAREDGAIHTLNIRYKEEKSAHPALPDSYLERSGRDLLGPEVRRLPIMREVFDRAADAAHRAGLEYFGFMNGDILMHRDAIVLARMYMEHGFEALAFVRTDIPALSRESPADWLEVHLSGADLFIFKTSWWRQYNDLLRDYIMSCYWWDRVLMGLMVLYGRAAYVAHVRGLMFHPVHTRVSTTRPDVAHNTNLCMREDSFYYDLNCAYIRRLEEFLGKQRSLPTFKANQELYEPSSLVDFRRRLRPDLFKTPAK